MSLKDVKLPKLLQELAEKEADHKRCSLQDACFPASNKMQSLAHVELRGCMNDPLIDKYNKGDLVDRILFHNQCRDYYRGCYSRLRRGEHFYPYGLTNESYLSMIHELRLKFFSLNPGIEGPPKIILDHFSIHYQKIHVWNIDWSMQVYFYDFMPVGHGLKIHLVVNITERKIDKQKCRFAIGEDGVEHLLQFSNDLYVKRPSCLIGDEMKIPADRVPQDWEFIFHREQTKRSIAFKQNKSSAKATILTFPES